MAYLSWIKPRRNPLEVIRSCTDAFTLRVERYVRRSLSSAMAVSNFFGRPWYMPRLAPGLEEEVYEIRDAVGREFEAEGWEFETELRLAEKGGIILFSLWETDFTYAIFVTYDEIGVDLAETDAMNVAATDENEHKT